MTFLKCFQTSNRKERFAILLFVSTNSVHNIYESMTDIFTFPTYEYDLALPKKDSLWMAIVGDKLEHDNNNNNNNNNNNDNNSNNSNQNENVHLSAFSLAILKEIQDYDKHRAKHGKYSTDQQISASLSLVLTTSVSDNHHDPPPCETDVSAWMCAICLDTLTEKNPNSIPCVTCQFCVPCLTQYVQLQIEEKSANMTSQWSMRCPCLLPGCELAKDNIERIIKSIVPADQQGADQKSGSTLLLAKFHKFALDLEIQNDTSRGRSKHRVYIYIILSLVES